MPGISGIARVAKAAATSKTTKSAARKVIKSNIVKTVVSGIVIDTALPELKKRVAERLQSPQADSSESHSEQIRAEELGEWDEPSELGIETETYKAYLRAQLGILASFEEHLETYEVAEFESYVEEFYESCEDPELQLRATELAIRSVNGLINHLKTYAVHDDAFREFVVEHEQDAPPATPDYTDAVDPRETLQEVAVYLDARERYLSKLLQYTDEDPEFETHVSSYEAVIQGSVHDLEEVISASVNYVQYLQSYASGDSEFQSHIHTFDPSDETLISLLESENKLMKEIQTNGTDTA